MTTTTSRRALRRIHLACALAMGAYLYSPWGADPLFHAVVAYGLFPALGLSGLWMWQQARLGRLAARAAGRTSR